MFYNRTAVTFPHISQLRYLLFSLYTIIMLFSICQASLLHQSSTLRLLSHIIFARCCPYTLLVSVPYVSLSVRVGIQTHCRLQHPLTSLAKKGFSPNLGDSNKDCSCLVTQIFIKSDVSTNSTIRPTIYQNTYIQNFH